MKGGIRKDRMKTQDFAYIVETEKSFDEAVVSVLKVVDQKNWSLFQIYDVKERLAAKGFKQKPLKIIEICFGKHANHFLNKNRLISLCMLCKINVLDEKKSKNYWNETKHDFTIFSRSQ